LVRKISIGTTTKIQVKLRRRLDKCTVALITGIAIERHTNEEALQRERDRLRLLLDITSSVTSKLNLRGLVEVLSKSLLSVTRSDFCALLLPDEDSEQLKLSTLYNPESRGAICDGAKIPVRGAPCGKAFRTGKTQYFKSLEEVRDDPESYGSDVGRRFIERTIAEGLKSGCDLPLIGRSGVVGVLAAIKRSESAQLSQFVQSQSRVSPFPTVNRLLRHPHLPRNLADLLPRFDLP
jgi:formate hydrogenlyase transcriptional activator